MPCICSLLPTWTHRLILISLIWHIYAPASENVIVYFFFLCCKKWPSSWWKGIKVKRMLYSWSRGQMPAAHLWTVDQIEDNSSSFLRDEQKWGSRRVTTCLTKVIMQSGMGHARTHACTRYMFTYALNITYWNMTLYIKTHHRSFPTLKLQSSVFVLFILTLLSFLNPLSGWNHIPLPLK